MAVTNYKKMFLISKEKYDLLCAKSMQGKQSAPSQKSEDSITCDRPCNCEKSTSQALDKGKKIAEGSTKLSVLNGDSTEQPDQNINKKGKRELNESADDDNGCVAPKKLKVGQENIKEPFSKRSINSNQDNRRNAREPAINKTKDNNINAATKKNIGDKSTEVRSNPSIFDKGRNGQHEQNNNNNNNNNKRKREVNGNDDNDNTYITPKKLKLDNNGTQNNNRSTEVRSEPPISNKNTNKQHEKHNKNKRKRESNENDDDDDTYPISKKLKLGNNGTKTNNQCTQNKKKYRKVFVRETKLLSERNKSNIQKPILPLKRRHNDDDIDLHVIPPKRGLYKRKPIISCIGNKMVQNKWIRM